MPTVNEDKKKQLAKKGVAGKMISLQTALNAMSRCLTCSQKDLSPQAFISRQVSPNDFGPGGFEGFREVEVRATQDVLQGGTRQCCHCVAGVFLNSGIGANGEKRLGTAHVECLILQG